jgi:predicted short-subunit dehydrogenase-like oxidoreductase (DUF2520 family)
VAPTGRPLWNTARLEVPTTMPTNRRRNATPGASAPMLGTFSFIGAGAAGGTLARALAARGATITSIAARGPDRARALAASLPGCRYEPEPAALVAAATTVVLAVPDDALPLLDGTLPWQAGQAVIHLSGARGMEALPHAQAAAAAVAALHPLLSFPQAAADGAAALAHLRDCTWALETSDAALAARLGAVVTALGGRIVRLGVGDRVPYHIAAVLASNYVVALLGAAVDLWQGFGVDGATALDALLPLLRGAVESLAANGPATALTGPIARGDTGTVAAHLRWLAQPHAASAAPEAIDRATLAGAYRALARLAIPLAIARGTLSEHAAGTLWALLDESDLALH